MIISYLRPSLLSDLPLPSQTVHLPSQTSHIYSRTPHLPERLNPPPTAAISPLETCYLSLLAVSTCQTLELCSTEEDALALRKIKLAIVEQQRAHLASIRRWWYKPVAILGNQLFSIEDGQAVEFVIGKRMMCAMQAEPPRKVGYLVYDCVARALQQCVLRPKGRLTAAPLAVLRVQARSSSMWWLTDAHLDPRSLPGALGNSDAHYLW